MCLRNLQTLMMIVREGKAESALENWLSQSGNEVLGRGKCDRHLRQSFTEEIDALDECDAMLVRTKAVNIGEVNPSDTKHLVVVGNVG